MNSLTGRLAVTVALALACAPGTTAAAQPRFVSLHIGVSSTPDGTGIRLCGAGNIPSPPPNGQWALNIDGMRSDQTAYIYAASGSGSNFNSCIVVAKLGAPYGVLGMIVRYVGGNEVVGAAAGVIYWEPGGDHFVATG